MAYGRAGDSFSGQLQQNFVILHDKLGINQVAAVAIGPTLRGGMKRANEDGDFAGAAKRKKVKRALEMV